MDRIPTAQEQAWLGELGNDYFSRHSCRAWEEYNQGYRERTGHSREELNMMFLGRMPRDIRILEVGCGDGTQLALLRHMGFHDLWGVELRPSEVEKAHTVSGLLNVTTGSILDLPFRDRFCDLVFTSGVLMHISHADISLAVDEMMRVTSRFIWGYEYYSERPEVLPWRGYSSLMFTRDYTSLLELHGAHYVKDMRFPHEKGTDIMYLMSRRRNTEDARKAA